MTRALDGFRNVVMEASGDAVDHLRRAQDMYKEIQSLSSSVNKICKELDGLSKDADHHIIGVRKALNSIATEAYYVVKSIESLK